MDHPEYGKICECRCHRDGVEDLVACCVRPGKKYIDMDGKVDVQRYSWIFRAQRLREKMGEVHDEHPETHAGPAWATVRVLGDRIFVVGEIVKCDTPTATGRVYPRAVVERAVADVQQNIRDGRFFAVATTKEEYRIRLIDVAGVVRGISVGERAVATVELIETARGSQIVDLLVEHRMVLYARGKGSVKRDGDHDVVQADYALDGVGIMEEDA